MTPSTYSVWNTSNAVSVGGCLPWAVRQADLDTTGTAILIDFAEGLGQAFHSAQTINLTGSLDLRSASGAPISIVGPAAGLTIAGGGKASNFSVFEVEGNTKLTLQGLIITNGTVGGYSSGGGIYNQGTLTLTKDTIFGNSATGSFSQGGGIYNGGTLTLNNVTIFGNSATGSHSQGGGINNWGTLSIYDCLIVRNTAADCGGGISNNGQLTVSNLSTINANTSLYDGGGIYNSKGSTLVVTASTLDSNSARLAGGAIYNSGNATVGGSTLDSNWALSGGAICNSASLTVAGSKLDYNISPLSGGGIFNTATALLMLNGSELEHNTALFGGGIYNAGSARVFSSIVEYNAAFCGGGIYNCHNAWLWYPYTTVVHNTAAISPNIYG